MEIVLNNVTYSYKNKRYLDRINLKIEDNKITGITGDNKSILCLLIDSIKMANSGEILIGDIEVNKDNLKVVRNKVSMIKQEPSDQFFTSNVLDEITFLINRLGYQPKDINKKIDEAFIMVGLDTNIRNRDIDTLTIGEQKLLQIAISMLYNPDIIIFDEVFTRLDRTNRNRIIKLIKQLKNKYHKTVIISSNNIDLLYELTDNIVILSNTHILYQGKTTDIYQDSKIIEEGKIEIPSLVKFTYLARNKKIKLSYHTDILDLIKDVYKHV